MVRQRRASSHILLLREVGFTLIWAPHLEVRAVVLICVAGYFPGSRVCTHFRGVLGEMLCRHVLLVHLSRMLGNLPVLGACTILVALVSWEAFWANPAVIDLLGEHRGDRLAHCGRNYVPFLALRSQR